MEQACNLLPSWFMLWSQPIGASSVFAAECGCWWAAIGQWSPVQQTPVAITIPAITGNWKKKVAIRHRNAARRRNPRRFGFAFLAGRDTGTIIRQKYKIEVVVLTWGGVGRRLG